MTDLSKELLTRADLIFGKIADAAGQAGTFAMEQLPDIATQFILYSRVYYTSAVILNVFIYVLAIWAGVKWFKATDGAVLIMSFGLALVNTLAFVVNFGPMLMAWFAPKIFLITEIVKLVKG